METYTVQAPTLAECRAIMKERYGERAYIFQHKVIRKNGFLGLFPTENVIASIIVPGVPAGFVPASVPQAPASSAFSPPPVPAAPPPSTPAPEAAKPPASEIAASSMQAVLDEMKRLHGKLDNALTARVSPAESGSGEHESIVKIDELLEQNDFSRGFRNMILDRLRKELSVGELDNFAEVQQRCLEFIGERVRLDSGGISSVRPRVIVLVGPTGVGKTTTLCKLAAGIKYPENAEPRRVSLFTIDRYRIAADKQLGALAEYLHADFAALEDEDALRREIALRADNYDAILVDTVGRSPRDAVELAKMKKTLEACGKSEVYLVFTAATKTADIVEIMRQFEPFGYRAVIVTKLDETRQLGNVISALAETGKPLAYLTDGQVSTPKYLQRASLARLLTSLDGFNIDRERLNAHFGPPALNA